MLGARAILGGLAMACSGLAILAVATVFLARPQLIAAIERTVVTLGYGVAHAIVSGHHYTHEADIRAVLALDGQRSHLTLDIGRIRQNVEALPWVRQANVQRLLPDGLAVAITERKPAAVWQRDVRDRLIDAEGRTLSEIPRGAVAGLPVLTGNEAGAAAPTILQLIAQHPEIERRLVETRRIAGRRWTLVLASGTLLHLPGDGMAAAMAWLEDQARHGLLDQSLEAIDLRVQGQLVVRRAVSAAGQVNGLHR